MKIIPTRRTDYGIRALLYLAQAEGGKAKAATIAEAMDIPPGFLPQVLQELQRAGLVTSRPSQNGGYSLARPPSAISMLEIVEALEGSLDQGECALRGGPCRWEKVCAVHWIWSDARRALMDRLAAASLESVALYDRALAEGTLQPPPDSHRARAPSLPPPLTDNRQDDDEGELGQSSG